MPAQSPLSFMSSVFGMNNSDFGDNQMTVTEQIRLICECDDCTPFDTWKIT